MTENRSGSEFPERKTPVHLPHVYRPNQPVILYLTVCTDRRRALLDNREAHETLLRIWSIATFYKVGRYMLMPDHIHLFCAPEKTPASSLKLWVQFWKRQFTDSIGRRPPMWQRDFWDSQMRHKNQYEEKWEYVKENPVRAGLVSRSEDWPYQGCLFDLAW